MTKTDGIAEVLQKLNLSKDEETTLEKAFKDPKFKELFAEYIQEISDPKNRDETERYLKEIEQKGQAEQIYGKGSVLVSPEPGVAVRCKEKGGKRRNVFINICTSDKTDKVETTPDPARKGYMCRIPHTLGPAVEEADGASVTFDCVVHPDTLRMALSNARFMELVIDTAKEQVAKGRGVAVEGGHERLAARYRGGNGADGPAVQMVRVKEGETGAGGGAAAATPAASAPVKPAVNPGALFSDVLPAEKLKSEDPAPVTNERRSAFKFDAKKEAAAPSSPAPSIEIVERGEMDLQDTWRDMGRALRAAPRCPKELVVRFLLPGLPESMSPDTFAMEVAGRTARLEIPGFTTLERALPFAVNGDRATAQLHRKRSPPLLEVAVAVVPPSREDLAQQGLWEPVDPAPVQVIGWKDGDGAEDDGGEDAATASAAPSSHAQEPDAPYESETIRKWKALHSRRDEEAVSRADRDDPLVGALALPTPSASSATPATSSASPAPKTLPSAGEFVPAVDFQGRRVGYFFSTGKFGTGYYRDENAAAPSAAFPAVLTAPSLSVVSDSAASSDSGSAGTSSGVIAGLEASMVARLVPSLFDELD